MLKEDIMEKETVLANVKADLDAYNEQLKKNAQELLQVRPNPQVSPYLFSLSHDLGQDRFGRTRTRKRSQIR